jgi:ParB family chromosome partitioning protein
MDKYKEINIDDIVIQNERLWKIKDEQVQNLKKSIEEIGLMNPVTIQKRQDRYILIGGEHRYTACKQLGYKTIPCNIIPREYDNDEDEDARLVLMEVDENLVRRSADFLEESFLLNRRKIAYEKLNPGCTGIDKIKDVNKDRNSKNDKKLTQDTKAAFSSVKTFVEDTVEKTGLSPAYIRDKAKIGSIIPEDKKDFLQANKISQHTFTRIIKGKNSDEVKKAVDIHLDTLEKMKTTKNKNTLFKKAYNEVRKEINQIENPIEFAEKVQEIVPNIIEKEEKPKVDFSLNEDDLYEINELINTVPDADAIVVLVNGVEIYSKTKK